VDHVGIVGLQLLVLRPQEGIVVCLLLYKLLLVADPDVVDCEQLPDSLIDDLL